MSIEALLQRCSFPAPATHVRCGVSGGADSTALLVLAVSAGCEVTAVHIDHGLRDDSSADAALVQRLADRFGAKFESHRVAIPGGPNLEARARAARRELLGDDALLGHTADDQAETVLLAMLRGSGPPGLAGADPRHRPILRLRREETHALCAELGLEIVHDPTNDEPIFRRNRVRHELLPLLADISGRDPVPVLARLAEVQSEVAELLDGLGEGIDPADARAVAALPTPVAVAVLRRWWTTVTAAEHPPDRAAMQRMLAVARGDTIGCDVVSGWHLSRTQGRLRLEVGSSNHRR